MVYYGRPKHWPRLSNVVFIPLLVYDNIIAVNVRRAWVSAGWHPLMLN